MCTPILFGIYSNTHKSCFINALNVPIFYNDCRFFVQNCSIFCYQYCKNGFVKIWTQAITFEQPCNLFKPIIRRFKNLLEIRSTETQISIVCKWCIIKYTRNIMQLINKYKNQ